MSFKPLLCTTILATSLFASTAFAEWTAGIGVGYVLGEGPVISGKLFSDDDDGGEFTASAGIDYVPSNGGFRPNIGISSLNSNSYVDLNTGYNFDTDRWSIGAGAGLTNTDKNSPNNNKID